MTALGDHLDHDERLVLDLFIEEFQPKTKHERFMLGLYVSAIFLDPKECRSSVRLAGYTGVSRQRIDQIFQRALRKLRVRGHFKRDDLLCAACACRKDYKVTP